MTEWVVDPAIGLERLRSLTGDQGFFGRFASSAMLDAELMPMCVLVVDRVANDALLAL